MATETVEIEGHIIDSLLLAKVLDVVVGSGADYRVLDLDIGRSAMDTSRVRLEITAADDASLETVLSSIQVHGANRPSVADAELVACDRDGVLPAGFYSTTNLPTRVRVDGLWRNVENPEMDCAVVVAADHVRTVPMHRVRVGDMVVVGSEGIRVDPLTAQRRRAGFEFMNSEVSSEKPKGLIVNDVADRLRKARQVSQKILLVCGPAVIHTGAGPSVARLVRGGWVDVLFAGNGFATHDIESNVMGTSLGVSIEAGTGSEGGHANHLRVINEVRRFGSIAAAVEGGYIDGGVMFECVKKDVPFVLAGSLRDDGPLPDVMTDVVEAADAMRYLVSDIGMALMAASTLHAIGTGNLLPASVQTFIIDINQSVVTKLADRGSHQAMGIVTDTGLFFHELADRLEAS